MSFLVDISSSGSDAEIVLSAAANTYYGIYRITYSYSSSITTGAGVLSVDFGGTNVLNFNVQSNMDNFTYPMFSGINEAVTINLSGITLLTAKLSIEYYTIITS